MGRSLASKEIVPFGESLIALTLAFLHPNFDRSNRILAGQCWERPHFYTHMYLYVKVRLHVVDRDLYDLPDIITAVLEQYMVQYFRSVFTYRVADEDVDESLSDGFHAFEIEKDVTTRLQDGCDIINSDVLRPVLVLSKASHKWI